ncbi:MAG: RNA polymerase sigma factor [Pseudomonadota bacterium]
MSRDTTNPGGVLAWLGERSVRLYAMRLLRNPADVDDVLQSVAERLLRKTVEIEQPENYLKRAVRNAAIDVQRARSRRDELEELSHFYAEPFAHAADTELAVTQLQRTIADLPVVTAEMFRLHYLDGLSQSDIASRLGVHLSSVEKHLAKAKNRCLEAMDVPPQQR